MTKEKDYKDQIGKHLGRTSDGGFMKPYEAPMERDASLLVAIPRSVGRKAADIDLSRVGYGYDVWHAYEFSFLKPNKQPRTGTLKVSFDYTSENMIESKSFKLYLNSYDFDSNGMVSIDINNDLSSCAKSAVVTRLLFSGNNVPIKTSQSNVRNYTSVDCVDIDNIVFDEAAFDLNSKVRVADSLSKNTTITFHTANLRSNCEITNQKDTGHSFISFIVRDHYISLEDIARFIFSMRNSQHFHENVTEIIYDKLHKALNPHELIVANIYNRRGGLDIHSVRASSYSYCHREIGNYHDVNHIVRLTDQV